MQLLLEWILCVMLSNCQVDWFRSVIHYIWIPLWHFFWNKRWDWTKKYSPFPILIASRLIQTILTSFIYLLWMFVGTQQPQHAGGNERTFASWFLPSSVCVTGVFLSSHGWWQMPLPLGHLCPSIRFPWICCSEIKQWDGLWVREILLFAC